MTEQRRAADGPVLVWRLPSPQLAVSSAPLGGGLGLRSWVLNATVGVDYDRPDPDAHLGEVAGALELDGPGIGMLTAVDVRDEVTSVDSGVRASVTTGITDPIWAAASDAGGYPRVGTINAVCFSPLRLGEAALVNAVATVAEAKAQALVEAGVEGTGTCTDATAVLCPPGGPEERYAGPRSPIGAALARAVHASVRAAIA